MKPETRIDWTKEPGVIAVPKHPDRSKNASRPMEHLPCAICGKECRNAKFYLRLWYDGVALTEAAAERRLNLEGGTGDLGACPIGSNCLRQHPELKPFVTKE